MEKPIEQVHRQAVTDPTPAEIRAATAKLRKQHLDRKRKEGPGPYLRRGLGVGRLVESAIPLLRGNW